MQRFDFQDMQVGSQARGAACLVTLERRTTRTGKPWIQAEVRNASGQATSKTWSENVHQWEDLVPGDPVRITARIEEGWRDEVPELVIDSIERLPDEHPIAIELNPVSTMPKAKLVRRFDALIDMIERPEARILLDVVLDHQVGGIQVREQFMSAPAAKTMHHPYIHGLLEHSCEVAEGAWGLSCVAPYHQHVDRSLLILGSLIHDVGKIFEYEWGPRIPIDIGHDGRLRSHLCTGSELVALAVAESRALEAGAVREADVLAVQHIIQSHHGEWGSPVQPRCLEALLVHLADLASSRMRPMFDALKREQKDQEHWVHPHGWKRHPVWDVPSALETVNVSEAETSRIAGAEEPAIAPASRGTAALVLPARGGDHA